MSGRTLLLGGLGFLVVFTAALWYTQFYAFYQDLPRQPLTVMGQQYPVVDWQGIDATSSPLKKRVCLSVTPETAQKIADEHYELAGGTPLVAPGWFECFDARRIAGDLEAHRAQLYMVHPGVFDGVDEYVALYPDGTAFIWRQLQPEYLDK